MAVAVKMAQTSTSQPDLWKPRYAARQHQEHQTQHQQLPRSRSLREPFDAAELTRKLENYRQELKLEKARRELAEKKIGSADQVKAAAVLRPEATGSRDRHPKPETQRSTNAQVLGHHNVNVVPERRRSLIHRRPKPEFREEPTESAGPYVPRVAARQFTATTTPMKKEEQTQHQIQPETKIRDTSKKHKLDWNEPVLVPKSASPPPPAHEAPDAEVTQKRMHALHAFQNASKSRPRPLSTAFENMRVWDDYDFNPYMNLPPKVEEEPQQQPSEFVPPTNRPLLKHGDRHDWSQASQCGDSARQSLHLFRRKDAAGEEAELAGLKVNARSKPRQKSHGDAQDRLVNDAVKLIREERRRSSILGIFRRH